jgi:hypothetical protein
MIILPSLGNLVDPVLATGVADRNRMAGVADCPAWLRPHRVAIRAVGVGGAMAAASMLSNYRSADDRHPVMPLIERFSAGHNLCRPRWVFDRRGPGAVGSSVR